MEAVTLDCTVGIGKAFETILFSSWSVFGIIGTCFTSVIFGVDKFERCFFVCFFLRFEEFLASISVYLNENSPQQTNVERLQKKLNASGNTVFSFCKFLQRRFQFPFGSVDT